MRRFVLVAAVVAAALLIPATSYAQAAISAVVKDPSIQTSRYIRFGGQLTL
jgi:hypothetical protein